MFFLFLIQFSTVLILIFILSSENSDIFIALTVSFQFYLFHPVIVIQLGFVSCPDFFLFFIFLFFLSSHIFLILFHGRASILNISN